MAIDITALGALMTRFTNKVINHQINLESVLLKKKVIDEIHKEGEVGVVNIRAGESSSVKFLVDGAALPTGSDVQPTQATYFPVALFGRVNLPRMAARNLRNTKDAVDLVEENLKACGDTMAQNLGRAIYGSDLGSPAATVNTTATTFTIADASAFNVGKAFEVYNGSTAIEGHTEGTLLIVTNIARPVTGEGNTTVTFSAAGGAGSTVQWLTTYTFRLRGSMNTGASMVSLTDAYSNSGSLYGAAANQNEWSGNSDATATELTLGSLQAWHTAIKRRRREKCSAVICNSKNEERYKNLTQNQRRFISGKIDAIGDQVLEVEGLPMIIDENLRDSELFFFNKKDIKLHKFQEIASDFDGAKNPSMGMGSALVSGSHFIYDFQVWGAYNLRVERRNGGGKYNISA
jgi:hypothetical protein